MLPIAFAALLGVALGRFFRVATLAPGAAATLTFALAVEWSNQASLATSVVVAALGVASLQLGYLVGSLTAHPNARRQGFYSPASNAGKISADL